MVSQQELRSQLSQLQTQQAIRGRGRAELVRQQQLREQLQRGIQRLSPEFQQQRIEELTIQARQERGQETVDLINRKIAELEANKFGASPAFVEQLEERQLRLGQSINEGQSGLFDPDEFLRSVLTGVEARQLGRERQRLFLRGEAGEIPVSEFREALSQLQRGQLTFEEAELLSPQLRQALFIPEEIRQPTGDFLGPVRPGESELFFRTFGITRPSFEGPVQFGASEQVFRAVGEQVFPTPISTISPALTFSQRLEQQRGSIAGTFDVLLEAGSQKVRSFLVGEGIVGRGSPAEQLFVPRFGVSPGAILLGAAFAPAFATAAGGTIQVTTRKKTIEQLFRELAETLEGTRFGTTAGIEADLRVTTRGLILKVKNDPAALKRLRDFYKRSGRLQLFDDLLEQEVAELTRATRFIQDQPAQLRGAGGLTGTLQPELAGVFTTRGIPRGAEFEREDLVTFPKQARVTALSGATINFLGTASSFIQPLGQRVGLQQATALSFALGISQSQATQLLQRQTLQQRAAERERQRVGSGLALALGLSQQQQQRFQQQLRLSGLQRLGQPPRQPPRIPGPRVPIPIIIPTPTRVDVLRRAIAKVRVRKQGFDVLVRKKGKFKKIADDLPFFKALKKGRDFVDKDLSATFRLIPDKRTKKKDIAAFGLPKFRSPKTTSKLKAPFTFIEKSKFRLDDMREVLQIGQARRSSTKKRKTRRKKKR